MPRIVLLEHRTPDGGSHFDWLLAPDEGRYDANDRVLITFRVSQRVDLPAHGAGFEAQRIADHRWLYLGYEGDLSNSRGSVMRLAEGIWTPELIRPESISGMMEWDGGFQVRLEGRLIGDDRWVFQSSPAHRR